MFDTQDITMVKPLFVKSSELSHLSGNIGTQLCRAVDHIQHASAAGAQKIRGVWYLYFHSERARRLLLDADFGIQGRQVNLLTEHPFTKKQIFDGPPVEKIVFRDIPMSDPAATDLIINYLYEHPHVTVLSDVYYTRMRTKDHKYTPYRGGDRFVYAQANFYPPLPSNTQIGEYNVRIWHQSQQMFCSRCGTKNMHRTSDIDLCDSYRSDGDQVVAFRDDWDILSNFFMCKIIVFGHEFWSAEQAYQWRKCIDCLRPDLAARILKASTPKRAKQIATEIHPTELAKWHKVSGHIIVMNEVLYAKSVSNIDFRSSVLKTGNKLIAESTRCLRWGTGLSPYLTKTTRIYPGANLLGTLLMELRHKLLTGDQSVYLPIPPSLLSPPIDVSEPPPPFIEPASPGSQVVSPNVNQMSALATVVTLDDDLMPNYHHITDHNISLSDDVTTVVIPPSPGSTSTGNKSARSTYSSMVVKPKPGSVKPPSRNPLIGKLHFGHTRQRRIATPHRRLQPHDIECKGTASDDEPWPEENCDNVSIASEILSCTDYGENYF